MVYRFAFTEGGSRVHMLKNETDANCKPLFIEFQPIFCTEEVFLCKPCKICLQGYTRLKAQEREMEASLV